MTTKLQGQPSVIFRQNFGFKPGLRNTLYSAVQGIQCDQYNSLPCQPVQTMDTSDNDNLANNFDSLKCEGENGYRGQVKNSGMKTISTRNVVTVNGRDTNNNGSVSPIDTSLPVTGASYRHSADVSRVKLGHVSRSGLPLRTSIPSLSTSSTCSKASSSPSNSSRNSLDPGSRIPISKSQDDLLRNVQLRRDPGRHVSGQGVAGTKLVRPTSYRNCSPRNSRNCSPRNSALMSRNSVEVLAYTESQKQRNNSNLNDTNSKTGQAGQRKYYSQYSVNKYENNSKFTKKFGSKDSSLNVYQKTSKKPVTSSTSSPLSDNNKSVSAHSRSCIPQPSSSVQKNNNKNIEKKPATPAHSQLKTSAGQSRTSGGGHNKLSAENKKNGRSSSSSSSCNNSSKSSANTGITSSNKEKSNVVQTKKPRSIPSSSSSSSESLKLDDHQDRGHPQSVNVKTGEKTETRCETVLTPSSMISQGLGPPSPGSADVRNGIIIDKILSDQLLKGKIPPKAKFRADDEISIGDSENVETCVNGEDTCTPIVGDTCTTTPVSSGKMPSNRKILLTPSKSDKMTKSKDARNHDPYPPSHASLLVAKCLEEGGGRSRDHKTNSLPLNSALVSFDQSDTNAAKSTSLDKYYKGEKPQVGKSTSEGFFQRLSNLRRSFNSHDQKRSSTGKIRPHIHESNSAFFQGISQSVRRPNSLTNTPSKVHHRAHHSLHLTLPPIIKSYKPPLRKYQFQRSCPVKEGSQEDRFLKRSFSFSDGQVIAQCVVDNDLTVIGDLFPAFLISSDNVYNVIDKEKLNKADVNNVNNSNNHKSINLKKLNKVEKDTNSSEQTLIGASIKDDHEVDKNDTNEASQLLDGSRVTLTASIVNINSVTGAEQAMEVCSESSSSNVVLNNSIVTNISVDSSGTSPVNVKTSQDTRSFSTSTLANTSPSTPSTTVNLHHHNQELSPIISPWTSRVTSNTSSAPVAIPGSDGDNVVRLDVTRDSGHVSLSSMSQPHPFIFRVQNQLNFSPGATTSLVTSSRSPGDSGGDTTNTTPDPFKKILAAADDNICQAESILSSLGYDGLVTSSLAEMEDSDEDMANGLGSDIETNIRRLEKTQAKINAALQTFRNVQNQRGNLFFNSTENSIDDKNMSFCSLPAHEISLGDKFKKPDPLSVTTGTMKISEQKKEKRDKKTGIIRRHSFNNLASKEKSPPVSSKEESHSYKRESMYLYDGDIDSSEGGNRNSSTFEDASDTEGNFSPFKNRIRGIFGSFGKGKKNRLHADDSSYMTNDKKLITIEYPDSDTAPSNDKERDGTFSIGHFTELVKSLPAHQFSGRESPHDCLQTEAGKTNGTGDQSQTKPTFLRPRDPDKMINNRQSKSSLCHNNSSDTYSSSINMSSNRNSVISTQSNSSESYEQDTGPNSVSDNGDMTQSSTSPKESRPAVSDYISSCKAQEKKVYYIAKEIMTSEKTYVDVLKLINIDFRDYVQKARLESKSGILPDHDFVKLFSNLPELMMLNEDLLRDFQERINNWDSHKKIADVIIKKGPYLKLYTVYIRDFSAMNFHFDEVCQRYPKFGKLVKEFEKMPRCQNLKLKHFMLKPVQRLPQYKLLLEDYLKHLDTDSIDWDDTTLALKIVSDAAEHANNTVKQGDKFQTMLKLQSRLGDWEFIRPGRDLVKEGELAKISRKGVTSRYLALLSDCLLYCSYQGSWAGPDTSLKVGHTIPLNQLQVHVPTAEDFQNEFSITSNVRSCTLRARNVQERNDWLDALNSAIEDYRSRKATFVSLDHHLSPHHSRYKLGDAAPVWIPDTRVTMCQSCTTEFSLVHRRHHCRACGKVVCAPCSSNKAPLRYRQFESSRVCDSCYEAVEKIYGDDIDLRSRFKRRDISRTVARFVPQRLKLSANSEGSQVSGYLRRKQKNSKWKRCWFVLKDRVLYTYRASEDSVAIDTLPVLGWTVSILDQKEAETYDSLSSYQVFTLSHPGSSTLMFCAENENSAEKWISSLRDAVSF